MPVLNYVIYQVPNSYKWQHPGYIHESTRVRQPANNPALSKADDQKLVLVWRLNRLLLRYQKETQQKNRSIQFSVGDVNPVMRTSMRSIVLTMLRRPSMCCNHKVIGIQVKQMVVYNDSSFENVQSLTLSSLTLLVVFIHCKENAR